MPVFFVEYDGTDFVKVAILGSSCLLFETVQMLIGISSWRAINALWK